MTLNENIRRIRLQKGMTQKQVAEACGTVDAVIRAYELGKANPKPATVAKIAKALGVSPAVLYGVQEDGQLLDQDTASALYQIKSGGVIDAEAADERRLLAAYRKLTPKGKTEAIKRAEELAYIPEFGPSRPAENILGGFSEDEQREIRFAYHSVQNLTYELSIMDKQQQKMESLLPENPALKKKYERHIESRKNQVRMIDEKKDSILKVILAALDRSSSSESDK